MDLRRQSNHTKESTLKNCCKNLNALSDTFSVATDVDCTDIVKLAKQIGGEGFYTMESADIVELLEEEPMASSISDEDDDQENDVGETESEWNLRDLREGFQLADTLLNHF